jgi:hypothetical protein
LKRAHNDSCRTERRSLVSSMAKRLWPTDSHWPHQRTRTSQCAAGGGWRIEKLPQGDGTVCRSSDHPCGIADYQTNSRHETVRQNCPRQKKRSVPRNGTGASNHSRLSNQSSPTKIQPGIVRHADSIVCPQMAVALRNRCRPKPTSHRSVGHKDDLGNCKIQLFPSIPEEVEGALGSSLE